MERNTRTPQEWLKRAEEDFTAAQNSLQTKDFEWAAFQSQQAIEKSLKALHIKKFNKLIRSHDILFLARRINAPTQIQKLCAEINPSYIDTRYPDLEKDYQETDAISIINKAQKILKWSRKSL